MVYFFFISEREIENCFFLNSERFVIIIKLFIFLKIYKKDLILIY